MKKSLFASILVLMFLIPAIGHSEPSGGAAAGQSAPGQTPPANKPHLIVSNYKIDPSPVEPGASFTLSVDVLNTSKKRVDNLLVSIGAISAAGGQGGGNQSAVPSNAFATRTTGNSRYLSSLGAGATAKTTFELATAPKTDPGLYVALIDLNYISADIDYSSSQSVGVSVGRPTFLELQGVSIPKTALVGQEFPITFEGVNAGSFGVQGVALSLKSDGLEVKDALNFIGALDAGDSDSLEAKAVARRAGPVTAELQIKYRDDFNQSRVVLKNVSINIKARPKAAPKPAEPAGGGFFQSIGNFFKALLGLG